MVFTKLTCVLLHALVIQVVVTCSVGPPPAWASVVAEEQVPLEIEGQPPRRSLKTTVRLVDPSTSLTPGVEVGLEYEKLTPLPGVEDAYVALASWSGRRLSSIPGITLDASWPASEDGTTFGCVIACFNGGRTPGSVIHIGSGSKSAACKAGDLFAVSSTRNPGSWDIYVSGSFKGEVLHESGGAKPSTCVSSSQGCGFIGLVSVTPDFQINLANFDFIRAANRAEDPNSHIGRLSPSVFGVWLSGTVSGGSGTFGGEVNAVGAGNFTLTSGSKPRGFIGHFANAEFGFGLSWAKSLSDGRLNSDFPQISNVAGSPDCTVVFADEYKSGTPLFQSTWTPEYIPVANFKANTGGLPSAVMIGSFQLRAAPGQANVCRNPFVTTAQSLLTGWKIADGGKVNVISSRFRAESVKSGFAFAAITPSESFPSIEAGIYKSEIVRNAQTKKIKGHASAADPFIFADQGIDVTAVQGLSYDPYGQAWFFALQRTPQVCTLAAFDSLNQSAVFADLDRKATCTCTLGKFAAKSDISPETGEPRTQISITGSFGSGCAPQPSGSFGFSYPPISSNVIDPEIAVRDLIAIATSGAPITKSDLTIAGGRLEMFPGNFQITEASFMIVDKAVGDAIGTGEGLDLPKRPDRVTSVLSAALATPQYQSQASRTLTLLPKAVVLGADSTSAVAARAAVLGAVVDEFGTSTEVLRSSVSAAESLIDTVTASDGTIEFTNKALDSLMPVFQQAVKGLNSTDLRNQAVRLKIQLPAKRVSNANTMEEVEGAALKLQEWLSTASECPLNTCGELELAAASVSAIDDLLDKVAASPDLMSPAAAQAMLDVVLKGQANTDAGVVASVARKLSQATVKNSAPTSTGLEETLATLSLLTDNLQENSAAIDGLTESLVELHKSAIATPGMELTEAGFNDARQIAQTVIQSTDSASSIAAIEKVPSLVVMNIINSKNDLETGTRRLASLIPVFQNSSRMTPLLEETEALLDIVPSRDDLDVSQVSFAAITDIIIAGKQSPFGSKEFEAANSVAEGLATATTSQAGFEDNISIDAMLLLNNLDLYYGSPGQERVLKSSLKGVEDILVAAETSETVRADIDTTISLAKILLVELEGGGFSDDIRATAISLAQRIPAATTESTITSESLTDAPRSLQYLAQEFTDYNVVVSKAVEEVDVIVRAVETDDTLLVTEEGLQNMLSVLSVGIQNDANAELAWSVVDKLPFVIKKSLSPGETVRAGAKDLQMTLMWSTAQDPLVEGITIHNISDTEYRVSSRVLLPSDIMTAASHYVVLRHSTADTPSRSGLTLNQDREAVKGFDQVSAGTLSVALLDPSSMEQVHARRLQQVSQDPQIDVTWTFYKRNDTENPVRYDDPGTIQLPECLRVDAETGLGSADDCVPMPRFLPRGFHSLPNPNYRFPPPADSLEPFWILRPNNPENKIDCRTVRNLNPYPVARKSQELFGDVKFEGTECWFYEDSWDDPDADKIYPERGRNCMWDDLAQIFFGPDCAFSEIEDLRFLGCMCIKTTGDSWFQRTSISDSIQKDYVDDRTREYVASDWSVETTALLECVYAPILGVLGLGACILLFAWFWDPRRRLALLSKFFEAKHSFQCESALEAPQGKNSKVQSWKLGRTARFDLGDHLDEVWRWSLETHVFKVLAEDMEHYITLPPAQQATHAFFDTAVVHLCALVGLPMNRLMASIPMSASLMSWYPLNGKHQSIIYWRNQALGTSLVMGFFLNNSLISDQVAEEQIEKQDAYFAGCHPMGIRALIRRWRVMLNRTNVQDYGNGWHARCRVWKIIWLQRHDGLWDLTEDFLTAIGADPELLLGVNCAKVPAQDGKECVEGQVPAALEVLFYGESELRIQLWCTFLAKAFLELATDTFAEFSGREADPSADMPTLTTVIAKDAIFYAISQKDMDQALIDDLYEVHCQGTDELVASVENDALQLVRSFDILREERQKAWASQELEFITRETVKERQKRKHKEGKSAGFSRKDFSVVVSDFEKRKLKRNLELMVSLGEEIPPSGVVRFWNFISGVFSKIFHAIFYWNGTMRVGFSSITDALIVQERTLVVCTTWLLMLACLTVMFDTGGAKCCEVTKLYYRCGISEYGPEYCVRYKVSQFRSPAGVRYYSNTTELISSDISCIALRDLYPPLDNSFMVGPEEEQPATPDNCETFPRYNSVVDIMLASFIVAAMALPFKIILKMIFNIRRRLSFSSLWVKNAGLQATINTALGRGSGWQAGARALLRAEMQPVEDYNAMVAKPRVIIDDQKADQSKTESGRNDSRAAAKATKAKPGPEELTREITPISEISPASEASHQSSEHISVSKANASSATLSPLQRSKTLPSHHAKVLSRRSSRLPPPMLQQHASYI